MQPAHDNLVCLVRRVYRRLFMLRLVEGAGLGLLAASSAALVSLLILIGRGEPVPATALWILPVGIGAGALWTVLRRPRAIDAAMETDRQLNLADLLSTAMAIVEGSDRSPSQRHPTAEAFAAAVVAMADARCAQLSASSVVLNRLGMRAWGGIGLVSALVVSLGLVAANPLDTQASPFEQSAGIDFARSPIAQTQQASVMASRLSQAGIRPIVLDQPNQDENAFNPARDSTTVARTVGQSSQGADAANPEGAGPGVGTSHPKNRTGNPLVAEGTSAANRASGPTPAGGVGSSSNEAGTAEGHSGGTVGRASAARVVPVWKSPTWPMAQDAAKTAVQTGQIPQEYHDLIRAYFDR